MCLHWHKRTNTEMSRILFIPSLSSSTFSRLTFFCLLQRSPTLHGLKKVPIRSSRVLSSRPKPVTCGGSSACPVRGTPHRHCAGIWTTRTSLAWPTRPTKRTWRRRAPGRPCPCSSTLSSRRTTERRSSASPTTPPTRSYQAGPDRAIETSPSRSMSCVSTILLPQNVQFPTKRFRHVTFTTTDPMQRRFQTFR